MNNRIFDQSHASDAVKAGMLFSTDIEEIFKAPAITYDCELIGPGDKNRDEFLQLMFQADLARDNGKFFRAAEIRREAEKLLDVQWKEHVHNTVMTAGKTFAVDTLLKGSGYTAAWFLLLVGGSATISAADTMASHAGWTEQTPYVGSRPSVVWGTTSSGSNTASAVVISINATATVTGAGVTSNSTAGGSTGTLYSASNFAAARSMGSGDTLNVTPTLAIA